jgi:hypothetical protein
MLARAERTDDAQRWQTITTSLQDRSSIREFNCFDVGRDAYPASDHKGVGLGAVVVASIWLVFYVIAAVDALTSGR